MQLTPDKIFAGRYRLLSKIGIGGFSEVWKVADEMAEDRIMVLKIYAPERGLDEFGIKQFRREYAITLDLNHPNLLKANHFDVFDGSPYLIMPFCEGGSLYNRFVESGKMSERQIAEMLVQVGSALEYLHENDVLHQDIKPDNILIDRRGNYLLTDFGISGRLRSTLRKSTTTKKSLTVAYAPPERFSENVSADEKSDVFSLGVMAVELLTEQVPWDGNGGMSLIGGAKVPGLNGKMEIGLATLLEAALQLNPEQRPAVKDLVAAARWYLQTGQWGNTENGTSHARQTQVMEPTKVSARIYEQEHLPPSDSKIRLEEIDYQQYQKPLPKSNAASLALQTKPSTALTFSLVVFAEVLGIMAFLAAATLWAILLIEIYEYSDLFLDMLSTPTEFYMILNLGDVLFCLLNAVGFALWAYIWLDWMVRRMLRAGYESKQVVVWGVVFGAVFFIVPLVAVIFLFGEGSDLYPASTAVYTQLLVSIVIVVLLVSQKTKKLFAAPVESLVQHRFWLVPLVLALGSFVLALGLIMLRTTLG